MGGLRVGAWTLAGSLGLALLVGGVLLPSGLAHLKELAGPEPLEEGRAAEVAGALRGILLWTGAAAIVAAALGAWAARSLSHPLVELRAAARRIAGGDLSTPVAGSSGAEVGGLAEAMEDMRGRLRAAGAALRESEAEASALLSGIVEGVFAVDGERRIQYLNPQAAQLLGVAPAEAIGRFCGDVLHPAARDGQRPCDDACPIVHARSRGSSRAVEQLDLPAGRRTVVLTSAPPEGSRQVQLMRDETELETARRSRDAVLANVSHELKTPLSAQLASIELLQEALERADGPAAVELLGALERSALRLTRLIDNLLESVRIETGREGARRVRVDLAACVGDAEAMVLPLLLQRRQTLQVELPEQAGQVLGDPVQLAQVLVNLLANAHKHAPEGSTLAIGGRASEGAVTLWVDDAGPGVPATDSASIFDRAWRTPGTAAEGMGLGLWIVKAIVERHGGEVAVGSAPSGGARFSVTLPAEQGRP